MLIGFTRSPVPRSRLQALQVVVGSVPAGALVLCGGAGAHAARGAIEARGAVVADLSGDPRYATPAAHGRRPRSGAGMEDANMTTGIGDMAVYIPKLLMRLSRLLERYSLSNPTIKRILDRAIRKTGQISVRFPHFWENAVTMAAQAAMQLLSRMNHSAIASLRYIAVGTESATDMAKPIAAHVGGMLRAAGFPIPGAIATFQTQHACAGGTYSLLGVNALLSLSHGPRRARPGHLHRRGALRRRHQRRDHAGRRRGGDDRRTRLRPWWSWSWPAPATPRATWMISFGRSAPTPPGCAARFRCTATRRPSRTRSSITAGVPARRRRRHCNRPTCSPFHAPYHQLPLEMMSSLLTKYLGLSGAALQHYLARRDFDASIAPAAIVGNLYSGSVFLGLASLLQSALPAARRADGGRTPAAAVVRVRQHGRGPWGGRWRTGRRK